MHRERFPRLVVMMFLLMLAPFARATAADGDPSAFMQDIGNHVLTIMSDRDRAEAARKDEFVKLCEQAFDVPKIAQFVLGRYWRTATDDEKKQYIAAFETHMIQVYWTYFSGYHGETFRIKAQRDEGNGTILVTTEILRGETGLPPVAVTWSLVKQGDSYKIRDASLEGVSQALTYRDEFGAIIERSGGGVLSLIKQLNDRAKS